MIKAGNYTIQDNGFANSLETVGGIARQVINVELPEGISNEELEAFCAGPIEVLDENGEAIQAHDGPFRVISHSMKLTRTTASGDVAALTARVATLEAELSQARSEKKSALNSLASLNEQLLTLRAGARLETAEFSGGAAVLDNAVGGVQQ